MVDSNGGIGVSGASGDVPTSGLNNYGFVKLREIC